MNRIPADLLPSFEECRSIHKKYGKSYYFATQFFPYEKRLATYALYAFFRIPDEIVDSNNGMANAEIKDRLTQWKHEWQAAYTEKKSQNPILCAASWVFHAFHIPVEYSESFFQAMIQDTEKTSYATYAELEDYMYGSAAVVGLMMSYVIGFSDPSALIYARKLGEAMQLTNFLRDIREDWDERKRLYLPTEDLSRFAVPLKDIAAYRFTREFKQLMQFEIERADKLYEEANLGIPLLNTDGRFAVQAASQLYREILRKIESQDHYVFRGRARMTFLEKFIVTLKAYQHA